MVPTTGTQNNNSDLKKEALTEANWMVHVKRELLKEADGGRFLHSQVLQLKLFVNEESEALERFFRPTFEQQAFPTEKLLTTLASPRLVQTFQDSIINIEIETYTDEQQSTIDTLVTIGVQNYMSNYEMHVFANGTSPSDLIEKIRMPAKSTFTVGRSVPNSNADVLIGDGDAHGKYPQRASNQRSLLSILSRTAFTLQRQTDTRWLCQARKQGEFMMILDAGSAKKMIPLRFPYRMVPLDVNDEIVILSDFQNVSDRLYIKIVSVEETNF